MTDLVVRCRYRRQTRRHHQRNHSAPSPPLAMDSKARNLCLEPKTSDTTIQDSPHWNSTIRRSWCTFARSDFSYLIIGTITIYAEDVVFVPFLKYTSRSTKYSVWRVATRICLRFRAPFTINDWRSNGKAGLDEDRLQLPFQERWPTASHNRQQ